MKQKFPGLMGNQLEHNKLMADRLRDIADKLERSELLARQSLSVAGLIEATGPKDTEESWIYSGICREHLELGDLNKMEEVPLNLRRQPIDWEWDFPETELMMEPEEH